MSGLLDKTVGLYHFFSDRVPEGIPLVEPKPRMVNPWCKEGRVQVARVAAAGDLRRSVERLIALMGNLGQAIKRGDRVLVKPNFNSPDPYPGCTDSEFLRIVVELLKEAGAKVTIGESAGGVWRPTRKVFSQVGLYELAARLGVELVAFEERADDWIKVRIGGDYLKTVTVPRVAYESDKMVYLPCLKTHHLARFSGALKLGVGLMHPGERRAMHVSRLEPKVAEINLWWQPVLIIMDGRKAFVSGGPDKGKLVEPGLLLASGDMVAIDAEAMTVLLGYKARNRLLEDPWQSPQVVCAMKHGLGVGKGGYIVAE